MSRPAIQDQAHRTLAEWLAGELRREIRSGELPGGTHLRQTEIAERFGVSSTPVREAFALLQRSGLLTSRPHKGVFVASPSIDDLRENFEIRMALEALCARVAVPRLTPEDIDALRRLLEEMKPLSLDCDYQRYFGLNEAFHDTLYEAAARPRLHALVRQLRGEPAAFLGLYGRPPLHLDARRSNQQHRRILAACANGDAEEAGLAMSDHLEDALRRIEASLDGSAGHRLRVMHSV